MLGHHCAESVLIASEVVERPPGASCFLIARGTVVMETHGDDQRTPSPLLAGQKAAGDAEGRAARERREHTHTRTHTRASVCRSV